MATRSPTGAITNVAGVVHVPDVKRSRRAGPIHLRVATQAKIGIPNGKELLIHGPVRTVARHAAFAQRRVLKNERPGLVAMTVPALLVQPRHRRAARGRLHDVVPVRIVALHAIHLPFRHRMMLRQMKLRLDILVALEARRRLSAGIDDEFLPPCPANRHMLAARSVAGFTARLPFHLSVIQTQTPMRARGKDTGVIRMTIRAGFVSDERRPFNVWRFRHRPVHCGAGNQKRDRSSQHAAGQQL